MARLFQNRRDQVIAGAVIAAVIALTRWIGVW